jgi:hypothetical protein
MRAASRVGFAAVALIGAAVPVAATPIATTQGVGAGARTLDARRVLAFEVPAVGSDDAPRWLCDWDVALEESARRNVPLVAVLCDEGSAFKTVTANVYSKPAFAAFSRKCVLLAAFSGRKHGQAARKVDGKPVNGCALFGGSCDDHQKSFTKVQERFATREFWFPLHVFVAADGTEQGRLEGHETTQAQLDDELERVRKPMGPGLDLGEYRDLLTKLKQLVDPREKRGAASVHGELGALLQAEARADQDAELKRPIRTPAMRRFVAELQSALVEEGEGRVDDAQARIAAGDAEAARKELLLVQKSFKQLAPGARATKLLESLPSSASPKRDGGP